MQNTNSRCRGRRFSLRLLSFHHVTCKSVTYKASKPAIRNSLLEMLSTVERIINLAQEMFGFAKRYANPQQERDARPMMPANVAARRSLIYYLAHNLSFLLDFHCVLLYLANHLTIERGIPYTENAGFAFRAVARYYPTQGPRDGRS